MISTIKSWFAVKTTPVNIEKDVDVSMVGEPVISFVRCLKSTPKRFKLRVHSRGHVDSFDLWPARYSWMHKHDGTTGYYSLEDRNDGSMYYTILHKGSIYSVSGIQFSLNAWEMRYIRDAFFKFRKKAVDRKEKIEQAAWDRYWKVKNEVEKIERTTLMEKFK